MIYIAAQNAKRSFVVTAAPAASRVPIAIAVTAMVHVLAVTLIAASLAEGCATNVMTISVTLA